MKKQLLSLSLVSALVLSPIASSATYAESKPKDPKTEINYTEKIRDLNERTNQMLQNGVVYSNEKSAEEFKISDNGSLLSSKTIAYNEDGSVKSTINNEFGVNPNTVTGYVVISDGGYFNWTSVGAPEYGTNKLDLQAYNVALKLLTGLSYYVKNPTVSGVATVTKDCLRNFGAPAVYYYTQKTYRDYDSINDYVKTITYTYSDSARTKLAYTEERVQKFAR